MADNTTLNTGTGGDVIATDDIAGVKHQLVKLEFGALDTATPVSTSNPLPVSDSGGSLTVDNAGTFAVQIAANSSVNQAQVAGTATDTNSGVKSAGTQRVVLATDQPQLTNALKVDGSAVTQPVSLATLPVTNAGTFAVQDSQKVADNAAFTDGTTPVQPAGYIFDEVAGTALTENDAAAARIDSKRAQVGVLEDATTRGQRAAVSAGGALKVDGSAVTQPVSGTVTANAGTGPFPVSDNAGSLTVDASAATFGVNQAQVSGTAVSVNSGVKDAGTARVILASDQTVVPVSDNAGSLTVDAPVGTPVFVRLSDGSAAIATLPVSLASLPALVAGSAQIGTVSLTPATSGGLSTFHLISAATTNATNVKASAGQLFGWYIRNLATTDRKVVLHNNAGAPTAGAGVIFSLNIPAGAAANVFGDVGIPFATGIAITTVTGAADTDATAVALNDLDINLFYK